MRKPARRRPYDATRRRRRAAEAQQRVLDVARRLFAERGYAETTMEAIAGEAEIAVPTLYAAFQSKRGLLSVLLSRLISGDPGGRPLLQTPGARAVLAERDPRRLLALFVADLGRTQERVIPLYEVMRHASRTEPDIEKLVARAQAHRFSNLVAVAARLAELHALRSDLTVEDAGRTLWAIASPEVRQMLLTFARWSVKRYQRWLEDILAAALLQPDSETSSHSK